MVRPDRIRNGFAAPRRPGHTTGDRVERLDQRVPLDTSASPVPSYEWSVPSSLPAASECLRLSGKNRMNFRTEEKDDRSASA
ncbi:hypothetical protein E2C01_096549 [Portunus trituberculatus]|uniref:Uncharacterized protein n=1 Tax=Portunus trituberculatus TaxID=210409 RepID=A0A5B7K748_PORTR|nr:hypothetical protein [Portunus trituberculatus]